MSILDTIKKMLGIEPDYDAFDTDIIVGINSALMALNQIGVGLDGMRVTGRDETWETFLNDRDDLEAAKTYVYLKTKLGFDTPANAYVVDALQKQISEYEWRLNVNSDRGDAN